MNASRKDKINFNIRFISSEFWPKIIVASDASNTGVGAVTLH